MFKKGFAALVILVIASALSAWAASTYQVQTKLGNAGGTIQLGSNALQTTVGTVVYSNFTSSAAVPVTVRANTGYRISSVTKTGVSQAISNPASFSTSFVKSAGATQSLLASFTPDALTVSASVQGAGSISPASATVNYNGSVVFTASPASAASILTAVSGGVATTLAGAPVSFPYPGPVKITASNVTASRLVTASFASVGADAGATQVVPAGQPAALAGSISNGGTPSWSQVGGPAVSLSGANTLTPRFTPPAAGTYSFRLDQVISGLTAASSTTQVTVLQSVTDYLRGNCNGCHGAGGVSPSSAFGRWSSSGHKQVNVTCVTCHTTAAMPTPVNTGSVNSSSFLVRNASAGAVGSYYCVKCHQASIASDYDASPHKAKGVACVSCHTEGSHNPAVAATACNGCHLDSGGSVPRHPFAIQGQSCATCHNPHSTAGSLATPGVHYNNVTSGMYPASYVTSRATCSDCHVDSALNFTLRKQWAASGHAATGNLPFVQYDFKTKDGCVQCHTTTGFIAYSTGKLTRAWGSAADKTKEVITCVACHSDNASGALRQVEPVAPFAGDGYLNRDLGKSNVCMACHSGVNNGTAIQAKVGSADFGNLPFVAPHYLAAGATLHGKAGYHFPGRGYAFYSSNTHRGIGFGNDHNTGTGGPCLSCHKNPENGHSMLSGSIALCGNCHGQLMTPAALAEKQAAYANSLAVLNAMLAKKELLYTGQYPYFAATSWGSGQAGANTMGAAYNYLMLVKEPGGFVHNAAYAKELVSDSIDYLYNGTVTGSIDSALAYLVGQGAITQAQADSVVDYKSRTGCTSCHLATSGSHRAHLAKGMSCAACHSTTALDAGTLVPGTQSHANGSVEVVFATGGSYSGGKTGTCAVYCHSDGQGHSSGMVWGGSGPLTCKSCHPVLTGSHAAHLGNLFDSVTFYNYTGNYSNASSYRFGCANCHPADPASHFDGKLDVTLAPDERAGALKNLNAQGIASTGIGQAGSGMTGTPGQHVFCSAAYCHSNGYRDAAVFATSPDWYGGSFTGDRCAGCHGNSPNSGQAGSSAHGVHVVGIHSLNVFSGGFGNLTTGAAGNVGHGDPAQSTTLNCNVCHNDTVTGARNDLNRACLGCHAGQGNAAAVANKALHVNGTVNVAFANMTVVSKAQLRPASFALYSGSVWTRNGGYKAGARSFDSSKTTLKSAAGFDAGTCSNVACHMGQQVRWTDTNAPSYCALCHTAL